MPNIIRELYSISQSLSEITYEDWIPIVIGLNRTGNLPQFLELINREDLNPHQSRLFFNNRGKVLIIGDSELSAKDIEKTCERFGLSGNRLELQLEYKDNYNFSRTQYSPKYSLILVGPLPHMAIGVEGESSIITKIMTDDGYPPVIKLTETNGDLHISKNSLKNALSEAIENRYIAVS